MDSGTKAQQHKRLESSPLVPSFIVETRRGYQAWWGAKNASADHWNAIVLERLVPYFGADKNARDICRILRAPGFLHLKDPAAPFRCRTVWRHDVAYTERQIAERFEWKQDPAAAKQAHDEARRAAAAEARTTASTTCPVPTETLWDAVYALDAAEGLLRLSGHWAVRGEVFTLKRAPRGRLNIWVDGRSSPCFVDENRRIGSPSGGGPTLAQWLRWYGHDWSTVIRVLKEVFPQLDEIDRAARVRGAA
jgi:hypothetical protein